MAGLLSASTGQGRMCSRHVLTRIDLGTVPQVNFCAVEALETGTPFDHHVRRLEVCVTHGPVQHLVADFQHLSIQQHAQDQDQRKCPGDHQHP